MEYLIIKDFLLIKHAEIEIKKINVLIGPQANGKSVIAKLVYFFKTFLSEEFRESIRESDNKSEITKRIKEKFTAIFPAYAWEKNSFDIQYQFNEYIISIKNRGTYSSFKFDYSKNLQSLHRKAKNAIAREMSQAQSFSSELSLTSKSLQYQWKIQKSVFDNLGLNGKAFRGGIFVPAGRSYFSLLQQSIFSFLKQNGSVDSLFAEFGSFYEAVKNFSGRGRIQLDLFSNSRDLKPFIKYMDELSEAILKGEFLRDDDKDWIKNGNRIVNVENSSSGQQEVLPLLLTLKNWPAIQGENSGTMFIEEPEAHLFPASQKHVVELIAAIRNSFDATFFLTTHSPYILTSLNTLIYAGQLIKDGEHSEKKNKILKIINELSILYDSDVSAYSVENGTAHNIFDTEVGLIDAEIIDETSEEIGRDFDQLMELSD